MYAKIRKPYMNMFAERRDSTKPGYMYAYINMHMYLVSIITTYHMMHTRTYTNTHICLLSTRIPLSSDTYMNTYTHK